MTRLTAGRGDEPDAGQALTIELGAAPRRKSFCEGDISLISRFAGIVADTAPDLVQAGPLTSTGWMAAMVGGPPLVAVSWGFDLLEEARDNEAARWLGSFALRKSSAVICDCATVRALAARELPAEDIEKIVTFPWGVDQGPCDAFGPAGPLPEVFRARSRTVVLSVRAWESDYGIETTMEAFRSARASDPGLGLVLAGGGSREPWIREFIRENDLGEAVLVAGRLEESELAALYRAADIYLSCTPSDGSSVSLLQAIAAGLPSVVADCPGNREWVVEGETGLFSPPGNAAAFSECLLLIESWSRERREQCRILCLSLVRDRADWSRHSLTLLSVYDALAAYKRSIPEGTRTVTKL